MSECTALTTLSTVERHLWGSVGFALPGTQVRIFRYTDGDKPTKTECPHAKDIKNPKDEEQGEVCFRGRHIMMGYLANPAFGEEHMNDITKKTNEAIDEDGWLRSGDMGCIGENGMVRITGRYKELIITAGGENIAPVPIENSVKLLCDAISNAVMIGDKRKFNTMLITLKVKEDGKTLTNPAVLVPGITTIEQALLSAEYRAVVQKAIEGTNADSKVCPSNATKVQKFQILPADFSVDTDELTPTLKLKRKVIEARHADAIEELYSGKPASGSTAPPPSSPAAVVVEASPRQPAPKNE